MAEIRRTAEATWQGDLRGGKGIISASSGVLRDTPYSFSTRFENAPGTNPEELVAAAHASCYSMALSNILASNNFLPESVHTTATLIMERLEAGWTATKIRLDVEGRVPNIDAAAFQRFAKEAEQGCPISRLLRPGLKEIETVAKLV
jgi:osmotically inducible protein OsmC